MQILFKNNKLISKSYNKELTLSHFKVFNYIMLNTQKKSDNTTMSCFISRNELYDLINDKNNRTIKNSLDFLSNFSNYKIYITDKSTITATSLIHTAKYDSDTDKFEVRLEKELYDMIINYKIDGYTPLDLTRTNKSKSLYSTLLYEEFRKWSNTKKTLLYSLDDLKNILLCNGSYDVYYEFKRRVLLPAIKEIEKNHNMKIEILNEIKRFRKVHEIEFSVIDEDKRQYIFDNKNIVEGSILAIDEKSEIDNIDYVNLIDMNLNQSIHKKFLQDFSDYTNYIKAVETASIRTLDAVGGKSINKRNYNYFRSCLMNLIE